jgi:hypothetical protein
MTRLMTKPLYKGDGGDAFTLELCGFLGLVETILGTEIFQQCINALLRVHLYVDCHRVYSFRCLNVVHFSHGDVILKSSDPILYSLISLACRFAGIRDGPLSSFYPWF